MSSRRREALSGDGHLCALTGKKVYRSPEEADRRRKVLRARHNERLHVYRCRYGFWHLAH